jgi:hypothetical protein
LIDLSALPMKIEELWSRSSSGTTSSTSSWICTCATTSTGSTWRRWWIWSATRSKRMGHDYCCHHLPTVLIGIHLRLFTLQLHPYDHHHVHCIVPVVYITFVTHNELTNQPIARDRDLARNQGGHVMKTYML